MWILPSSVMSNAVLIVRQVTLSVLGARESLQAQRLGQAGYSLGILSHPAFPRQRLLSHSQSLH